MITTGYSIAIFIVITADKRRMQNKAISDFIADVSWIPDTLSIDSLPAA